MLRFAGDDGTPTCSPMGIAIDVGAGDDNEATDDDTVWHLALEGGVGVGKSTCLAALAERFAHDPAVVILPEPVDAWRERGLLRRMYADEMTKLEFQLVALATIAGPLAEALRWPGVRLVITERSPLSSWRVFAELNLGGADMAAFELAYAAVQRMLPERREATAYLRLDAATTLQRIARRGRSEEGKLDGDFACAVTEQHEAMVGAIPHRKHYIDAAGSPAEVAEAVLAIAESMLQPDGPGHAAARVAEARGERGIAIDVGAGSPLVMEDLDSPIATAAEPVFTPGLPLAAVTSAWDEAADAWEAQRVAFPGVATHERQCAVCKCVPSERTRVIRLFKGVGRAIGKLLLLNRRIGEPSHAAASKDRADRQRSRLWFGLPTQGYVAAHCFVCSRKLTSMLHRREGDIVQLADQERFYYGRDMPPYCFCGARCHGIFEPWRYQLEELEHEERYDCRSLHWTIGEATYNCKRQLRAVRLFVGVGRAIGRLLLLRRWVAERSGQGGGGEGGEGEAVGG